MDEELVELNETVIRDGMDVALYEKEKNSMGWL